MGKKAKDLYYNHCNTFLILFKMLLNLKQQLLSQKCKNLDTHHLK